MADINELQGVADQQDCEFVEFLEAIARLAYANAKNVTDLAEEPFIKQLEAFVRNMLEVQELQYVDPDDELQINNDDDVISEDSVQRRSILVS